MAVMTRRMMRHYLANLYIYSPFTYPLDVRKSNCEVPHFVTWYDVISRCFHQETEGQELMDSSFCQLQPSVGFVKEFNKAVDLIIQVRLGDSLSQVHCQLIHLTISE